MFVKLADRDVPLRQTAQQLGMNPSYLSRMLSGKQDVKTIRLGTLMRIAEVLSFDSVDALVTAIEARRRAREAWPLLPQPSMSQGETP